jgi:hypothetical protein
MDWGFSLIGKYQASGFFCLAHFSHRSRNLPVGSDCYCTKEPRYLVVLMLILYSKVWLKLTRGFQIRTTEQRRRSLHTLPRNVKEILC